MDPHENTSAPLAGRREWLGLVVLALPGLLLSVDGSIIFLVLPRLSLALRASSTQQLWITDVYGFLLAGFLVTMGRLGDLIGQRRLLLAGTVCFGLCSVLAAYSNSAVMLIVARALLGVAGATIMPSALALIAVLFPNAKQQGMAIGVFISCVVAGAAIGPVIGGLLLGYFWWGSVFLVGVPFMLVLVAVGPVLLPKIPSSSGTRLDLVSVVLYLIAILPLIYGINELGDVGWRPGPLLSLAAGLVLAAIFAARQRRVREPLLDLSLFRNRAFSVALAIDLFSSATNAALGLYLAQYVQLVKGWTPLSAGVVTMAGALGVVSGSTLTPMVARKLRPGTVIVAGLGLMLAGFLLISQAQVHEPLTVVIVGAVVFTLGGGALAATTTGIVMASAPPEKAGSAGAVSETGAELGGALGIATLGSIGTAVYRSLLHVPSGVSPSAGTEAKASISRAAATAADLPGAVGTALLDAARSAFTTAFQAVTIVGAVISAGLAVLAFFALRHVPPVADEAESGPAEESVAAGAELAADEATTGVVAPRPARDLSNG